MAHYDLNGRVAVITGSTGGLGTAVCAALIAKGAKIALFDMDEAAVKAQASALGANARGWKVDVRSLDSLQQAMDEAADHFGGIDVVIANAGITAFEPLETADPGHFERVVDVNLLGVWRTFHAAAGHVQKRKGYLMAISSMAAFSHSPLQAAYTASKAGVWAMCNSIRLELRHLGVGVGSVHPTFFKTPMMERTFNDPAGKQIWNGNTSVFFKMAPLEHVVKSIVKGIEKRSEMIFVPRNNSLVAHLPRFFRKVIEAFEFKDDAVAAMIKAAKSAPPK